MNQGVLMNAKEANFRLISYLKVNLLTLINSFCREY
jgi:hypothetical protein